MTNFVTTKRALLTSVLSLVLCFAMLLGTTFAWFTDTVTSSGNVIQTGDLDVEMYYAAGTEDPATVGWTNADGVAIFNYDNWEPGYADAKHIKIVNNGTLAFDWMLRIISSNTVSDLAEVIDVYYFVTATECTRSDLANAVAYDYDDETKTNEEKLSAVNYLGTLRDVMNTTQNISNTVNGTLYPVNAENVPADAVVGQTAFTLVLVMQESAGNEYQGMSIGSDLSIQVFATQVSHENDSFGSDYDSSLETNDGEIFTGNVPSLELPAAYVRPIGKKEVINNASGATLVKEDRTVKYQIGLDSNATTNETSLDCAYQFLPTIDSDDVHTSQYRYWHADYVVYMDGVAKANSIALIGYYDAWCSLVDNNWVGLVSDEDITATKEDPIRLVSGLGSTVNYEEICDLGNDGIGFLCGAVDLDGSNIGKTLTVELRIYEVEKAPDGSGPSSNIEDETGRYITIGKFEHKFTSPLPVAEVERADQYVSGSESDIQWGNYGQWSPTEGKEAKLDAAFTFTAPETAEEVANSPYKNWECDYVVSLNCPLGENEIFLGGNYGSFGWIGFHNKELTLAANEEVYLLGSVTTNPWTYEDVVTNVGEFICGVGNVGNSLEGATFTVHLRLTNPETREHYDVNTVTYNFTTGEIVITDINDIISSH